MSEIELSISKLDLIPTKNRKICIETLITIFRNVVSHPGEPKYRTLKLSNKRFNDEVWQHDGGKAILLSAGWRIVEETIELPADVDIGESLEVLVEGRNVKPAESEWVEETKIIGFDTTKLREEQLRKKALEQKEKEMAALKKNMAERKAIAKRIVSEHRDDMEKRRATKPSVATPLGSGRSAKMNDMISESESKR